MKTQGGPPLHRPGPTKRKPALSRGDSGAIAAARLGRGGPGNTGSIPGFRTRPRRQGGRRGAFQALLAVERAARSEDERGSRMETATAVAVETRPAAQGPVVVNPVPEGSLRRG